MANNQFVIKKGLIVQSQGGQITGSLIVSGSVTADSLFGTSSWATNVVNSGGTSLGTGSTYPITSSWAENARTASYISGSIEFNTSIVYQLTASNASTSSWATNVVNDRMVTTGSSYPITSSWAVNWNSSSVITLIGTKQNTLGTGSTYPFTSSWATNWNSASVITLIGTKQNTLGTGSTYPITSSWAENATPTFTSKTDNYVPKWDSQTLTGTSNIFDSGADTAVCIGTNGFFTSGKLVVSGSPDATGGLTLLASPLLTMRLFVTGSPSNTGVIARGTTPGILMNSDSVVTIPTRLIAESITGSLYGTSSWAVNVVNGGSGTSLGTGSTYPITSSWAVNATNWNSSSIITLIGTKQNTLGTGSSYPITSSWAVNWNSSSIVSLIGTKQNTLGTGSTYPITSSKAVDADTVDGLHASAFNRTLGTGSSYPITSSWAVNATNWNSSSVVSLINTKQNTLGTGSSYPITSSHALSASYVAGATPTFTGKTDNYLPKWDSQTLTGTSNVYDDGTNVGIGTNDPLGLKFVVVGDGTANGGIAVLSSSITSMRMYVTGSPSNTGVIGRFTTPAILINSDNDVSIVNTLIASDITGSLFGTSSWATNATTAGTATNATNATNVGINTSETNATFYPTFVGTDSGNTPVLCDNSLTYNPSTNVLTCLVITGSTGIFTPKVFATSITGSLFGTSSWAINVVNGGSGTSLGTGSTYPITSSHALTASYITGSVDFDTNTIYPLTASQALSASYVAGATPTFTGKTDNYVPKWDSQTLTGTSLIYDDGSGIGIGTANPSGLRCFLYGDTNANGGLAIAGSGTTTLRLYTTGSPSNTGVIARGTTPAMYINSAGVPSFPQNTLFNANVGVGTNNALTQVHIDQGTVLTGVHSQGIRLRNTGSSESYIITTGIIGNDQSFAVKRVSNNSFPLVISSSGLIGIANTTPANTLDVGGGITATSLTASNGLNVTGNSILNGNVRPDVSSTYDLGDASFYWNNFYTNNIVSNKITSSLYGTASYAAGGKVTITTTTANNNYRVTLASGTSGNQSLLIDGGSTPELAYNPSTQILSVANISSGPITATHITGTTGISGSYIRASIGAHVTGSFGITGSSLRLATDTAISAALSGPQLRGWLKVYGPHFGDPYVWMPIYSGSIS